MRETLSWTCGHHWTHVIFAFFRGPCAYKTNCLTPAEAVWDVGELEVGAASLSSVPVSIYHHVQDGGELSCRNDLLRRTRNQSRATLTQWQVHVSVVHEDPRSYVLYHPVDACRQAATGEGAARAYPPMPLCAELIKLELLRPTCAACERSGVRRGAGVRAGLASRICSSESAPSMSCLLANTRSDAPASRCDHMRRVSLAWQAGRRGPAHLLLQQCLQLCLAVPQPHAVGRIHHPDEPVSLLEIVAPVGAQ